MLKLKILPHHAFMIAIKDGRIIVLTISSSGGGRGMEEEEDDEKISEIFSFIFF